MRHPQNVKELILDLWTRTRVDWGFATDRISEAFRREKGLGSKERRMVAETLYGMIRQARRVDYALEATKAPPRSARELARYCAFRILEGEMTLEEAAAELPGVDFTVVSGVDERIAKERDPVRRFGLKRSIPDWLARRLIDQFGSEADALAEALNARAPLTVRANAIKIERDALRERLGSEGVRTRPTPHSPWGLVMDTRVNAFGLDAFREGLFEVQDEASQLVAELVAPPKRGLIIDACAGAGGKTLALGAMLESKGRIVALDVSSRKLDELRRRARRGGLTNARAIEVQEDAYPDEVVKMEGQADRVLVDAPCSGVGALRRNPETRWRLAEEDLHRLPREQEAIARRAARLVGPGGRLIYATCSLLREENEEVVVKLLEKLPGFELMKLTEHWGVARGRALGDSGGAYLFTLPHKHDTDGFFAAVLRRKR